MATACCSAVAAESQKEFAIEIERQPLVKAMLTFSDQTGLLFSFFPETKADENVLVGPVSGTLTADAALLRLLKPNGFTYEWVNAQSIFIAKQRVEDKNTPVETRPASSDALAKGDGFRAQNSRRRQDIEFVVVMGTRMSTLEPTTRQQSVTVMDQQKLESYGVSTLSELFERLPQVPFTIVEGLRTTGEYYPNLRGFGSGTTLVLINGHRVLTSATGYDTGAFDFNTIPLTAIKRIEVLLGTPPIAAGVDASGGVVDVILKDEIPSPIVELRYGTANGGAEERRATFGIGTSQELVRGALTIDAFQRGRLLGSQRDITRDQDYRGFGGPDVRTVNASPGNIRSLTGANLPGLDSSFAAVPVGSTGIDLTPQDFIATAGHLNLDSASRFRGIFPDNSRISLFASGEMDYSPHLTLFAQAMAGQSTNELQTGLHTLSDVIVPASNAFNPFGSPVVVNRSMEELPPIEAVTKTENARILAGMRRISGAWIAEAWVAASRDKSRWSISGLDAERTMQALASSDSITALNPFRDGPAASPELLTTLVTTYRNLTHIMDGIQFRVSAYGPVLRLPAGEMTLMFGSEWHREGWQTAEEQAYSSRLDASPHRNMSSVFAELQIPAIDSEMRVLAVEELLLSLGLRGDDYTDLSARLTPQYGVTWSPFRGLAFRASYSDIHQRPTIWDMYDPPETFGFAVPDPRRGGEINSVTWIVGGNRNLELSLGRTWTAGFELTPRAHPSVRLSAGYWRTALHNRVQRVPYPTLLAYEDFFSDLIVRAEPTAQDIEAGYPGVVQSLDMRAVNSGWLKASGIDTNISFSLETALGRFSSALSAAWYERFETSTFERLPTDKRVGVASEYGTIPTWGATATIGWSRGPFSLFAAVNAISSYKDAAWEIPTGRTIDEQILVDLQGSAQLGTIVAPASVFNTIKITAGLTNAFDTKQQFSSTFDSWYGFDVTQAASMRQRFWYVRLAMEL